ncbi:MAG TPA: hypothetical protein VI278_05860 [Nitrososphaeraceae archaeon]
MTDSKREDVQGRIENLLRTNPSKSYSKEEIINLVSSAIASQEKIEEILGEIEVWSSMTDAQSPISSSCKGGTVYFQWGRIP